MANSTAPNLAEQGISLPDAPQTLVSTDRQVARKPRKKRKSPRRSKPREEASKPILPEAHRRGIAARTDDILADPRASRCGEPCAFCDGVPDTIAEAALAEWETQARLGTWPITVTQIRLALEAHGMVITYKPLRKLLAHRRWSILNDLVNTEIVAHQPQDGESVDTLSGTK